MGGRYPPVPSTMGDDVLIRRALMSVAGSLLLVGSGLALAPGAFADSGDGSLACNGGEICFSRDLTNTTYQKHFFFAGDHDGYSFTNVTNGAGGQGPLKDGADQVRNRDSSCSIKVVDDRGILPDDYQVVANNGAWTVLNTDVRNQNDRHERC